MNKNNRRFDMDWLRTLAVLLLVPFHAALVFNQDPRSIVYFKDITHSVFLSQAAGFVHVFHMPLLFFLSGGAVFFALKKRTGGEFLKERVLRLLVPLLFALAVFIPPMTYIPHLGRSDAPGFWTHYLTFFGGITDFVGLDGHFTPAHLWFILFLFLFSLAALPLFLWWKKKPVFLEKLGRLAAVPGLLVLGFVPLALIAGVPLLGDKNPLYYFCVFVLGYLLTGAPGFRESVQKQFWFFGVGGVVCYILLFLPVGELAGGLAYQAARWLWLLFFLGLGGRFLDKSGKALSYLGAVSYPFYIVHLPLLTAAAFLASQWPAPVFLKYGFIVLSTTAVSLGFVELCKQIKPLSFLLGMKAAPKSGK